MASSTRRFIVLGKVQGVGYRYFAARVARELNLSGWVRNLADGSVEAVAVGPRPRLDKFAGELHIGPPRAEVRHVNIEDAPPDAKMEGFHIR
ncbi:MAG: acylphosphatase [Acidobacteriota bacterium]